MSVVVVNLFFLLHFTTIELRELEALEKLAVENVSHIIVIVLFFVSFSALGLKQEACFA